MYYYCVTAIGSETLEISNARPLMDVSHLVYGQTLNRYLILESPDAKLEDISKHVANISKRFTEALSKKASKKTLTVAELELLKIACSMEYFSLPLDILDAFPAKRIAAIAKKFGVILF